MVTGSHWPVRTARQDSLVKASIKNKLAQNGAAKHWPCMELIDDSSFLSRRCEEIKLQKIGMSHTSCDALPVGQFTHL